MVKAAWYVQDGLGGVRQLVVGERVLNSYAYTAWGVPLSWHEKVSNRYTFTGREYNRETKMYAFRFRQMDSRAGRFLQRDLGIGFYKYCKNNPTNFLDSLGLQAARNREPDPYEKLMELARKRLREQLATAETIAREAKRLLEETEASLEDLRKKIRVLTQDYEKRVREAIQRTKQSLRFTVSPPGWIGTALSRLLLPLEAIPIFLRPPFIEELIAFLRRFFETKTVLGWEKWFTKWYREQKMDMAWLKKLPDCPCCLIKKNGTFELPKRTPWFEPTHWKEPERIPFPEFHPGAAVEIRTRKLDGTLSGQQCCYDAEGRLITGGLAAGTPDRISPSVGRIGHYWEDVKSFQVALKLGPRFLMMYLEVRPPNRGIDITTGDKPCPRNIVSPVRVPR